MTRESLTQTRASFGIACLPGSECTYTSQGWVERVSFGITARIGGKDYFKNNLVFGDLCEVYEYSEKRT